MSKVELMPSCRVRMAGARAAAGRLRPPAMPTTLELPPWDLLHLRRDPIRRGLLFYNDPQRRGEFKFIVDRLKNSLARTLDFFPPLSGRLGFVTHDDGTSSYFIDCNDAGAEFAHAVARGVSVSDVVEHKYVPEIVSSFFPMKETPNYDETWKPLLAAQVTELDDGFFVGCTVNHVVADGASFWHFFKSWSEMARGFDTISKVPIFDRWFPSNVTDENRRIHLPPLDQNPMVNTSPPPPLLERVFHFSKDSLAKLKNIVNLKFKDCGETSTFQALSAHLWRSVARSRLSRSSKNSEEPQCFILLVDARSRVPLPDGYFGNAVHSARIEVTEHELLENGLEFVAMKINELVGRQTREAVVKYVEDWVETPVIKRKGAANFLIVGSPRFDVYGCDFGWGKPVASRSGGRRKFDGKVTVLPAAQSGGIDVEVCLSPEALMAMDDDLEFMEAVTV
ncbi:uncharacterized acetyltransferase At3g50280-like [Andrographis paniculata]|uniref:uncharacterized acetyltransferase At3g50280-like n=1 Tax=Andrographis paniculata TaxID=175694 RepID=UPI0021E759F7|nr:uncharacterized acetyltransferase At3g50280-like [Andrographis paniculata]